MSWKTARWALLLAAVALIGLFLLGDDAWARVGGGHSYSSGRQSSGGGSGGGGGGEGELIGLVIWLIIAYPQYTIPILLVAFAAMALRWYLVGGRGFRVHPHHGRPDYGPPLSPRRPSPAQGVDALRETDPGFSLPALLDVVQLLHQRLTEAATKRAWEPLLPYSTETGRQDLERGLAGVAVVSEVVLGGIQVEQVRVQGPAVRLFVRLESTRLEQRESGSERVFVAERWSFERNKGVVSPHPDVAQALGCPGCGSPVETDRQGRCTHCGVVTADARLQWSLAKVMPIERRPVSPPALTVGRGGDEPSFSQSPLVDPGLPRGIRALGARHEDYRWSDFQVRASRTFHALQEAWSAGRWEDIRPHVTDRLLQTWRFWAEPYRQAGLQNRVEDVKIVEMTPVKVELDAWYESITVRIRARARDWTEDRRGNVVSGNRDEVRGFAEYWTFLRAAGGSARATGGIACPSCGAALDRVSDAGVCGYCDAKITTGKFDWVLSRIDQADSYGG